MGGSAADESQLWLYALCVALCATVEGLSGGGPEALDVLAMAWCWVAVGSGGAPMVVGAAMVARCVRVGARLPLVLEHELWCLQSDAAVAAPTTIMLRR